MQTQTSHNTHKQCRVCKQTLPLTNFIVDKRNKDGRGARCKPCAYAAKPYSPERQRRYKLKHSYGITPEQFDQMLDEQDGCKICHKQSNRYHVDHDHVTGVVRGILCHNCNVAIGHFSEDITVLKNAISYLSKYA